MTCRIPVLASLAALSLASCSPSREALLLDTRKVTAESLMEAVRNEESPVVAFHGEGSVAFDAPQMSGSVFVSVALRKPDSVCVKFEGPFGMDLGFLFANHDQFVLYNAMENWYVSEPIAGGGIRSVLPFELTFGQLMDAFTGSFRLPANRSPIRYIIDDDMFLLSFRQGGDIASCWIDPAQRVVARYRLVRGDSVLVEASADRWVEDGGLRAPRSISMTFPATSSAVSVFYSTITMNPEELSFSHGVPPGTRRRTMR